MATTIGQALVRMNGAHHQALRHLARGERPFHQAELRTAGNIRGAQKVMRTLLRWGAVRDLQVTPFGMELLMAADEREARRGR